MTKHQETTRRLSKTLSSIDDIVAEIERLAASTVETLDLDTANDIVSLAEELVEAVKKRDLARRMQARHTRNPR